MTDKGVFSRVKKSLTILFAVLILLISSVFSSGCEKRSDDSNNDGTKTDAIKLDYFNANRYTATIVENNQYIFWADSRGINRREKSTKNETLILKIKEADHLSLYEDHLYFVTDNNILHRINFTTGKRERLFNAKDNEYFLSQVGDYCIEDNKIFFINTHSLFYFDLASRETVELLNTSIHTLQVQGDTVYFRDHAERTFTIYAYSIKNNTVEKTLGSGITSPKANIYSDFAFCNGEMIYSSRNPYETYVIKENGKRELLFNKELIFSAFTADKNSVYNLSVIDENESILYIYNNGEQKNVATLNKLNTATGFAVVDGHIYYNSGYKTVEKQENTIYDYSCSVPTVIKIAT